MQQPSISASRITHITLVPRKANLVAVLETKAQIVGYAQTIVLNATASYDPDDAQVDSRLHTKGQRTH